MKRKLMLLMTFLMIGIGLVNAQVSKVTGTVTSKAFHFVIIKSYIRKKQNIENDNNFFVIITFF